MLYLPKGDQAFYFPNLSVWIHCFHEQHRGLFDVQGNFKTGLAPMLYYKVLAY